MENPREPSDPSETWYLWVVALSATVVPLILAIFGEWLVAGIVFVGAVVCGFILVSEAKDKS